MLSHPRCHSLITALTILFTCAGSTYAFEQGSYFVFDLVDSKEAKPIAGRLAIPAEALAKVDSTAPSTEKLVRSEFEIDFKQPIQPQSTASSSFEFDPLQETVPSEPTTSFGTDSFDFGSSDSIFGE